jgi:outer membrane protein OmpA-like peptidoglycan-associated protein
MPAPVVTPRTYLVFFDWDRADLTMRAREIVAQAAAASAKVGTTRIDVNGYTDRSGTAEYNQKLSRRRGESVAAELVRDGVPKDAIVMRAFGEADPLVPTADGVREPQNRRVEIILH